MKLEYKAEILSLWDVIKKFTGRDISQHSLAYTQLLNKLEYPTEKDRQDVGRWIATKGTGLKDKLISAMASQYGLSTSKDPCAAFKIYQNLLTEESNNNFLLNNLAYCYQYGYGVAKNSKRAFTYFKMAAEQGEPEAMNNLAFCFQKGISTVINLDESKKWLQKAAEANNPRAKYRLSQLGPDSKIEIDYNFIPSLNLALELKERRQTLEYLQIAAERGNSQALFHLGTFHRYGCFLNTQNEDPPEAPQPEKALEIFEQLIRSLHLDDKCLPPPDYGYWQDCWPDIVIALSYTAEYYKEQIHQDEKYAQQAFFYSQKLIQLDEYLLNLGQRRRSMEKDFCQAYWFLARCYRDNPLYGNLKKSNEYFRKVLQYFQDGMIISKTEALKYYNNAHKLLLCLPKRPHILELLDQIKQEKQLSESHQLFMQILDRFQFPEPEDHEEIKKILNGLEAKGDNGFIVGMTYQFGLGCEKNLNQAFDHFSRYKKYQDPLRGLMATQLGECYLLGLGTQPDYSKAYWLFKAESENHNPVAIQHLAFCHYRPISYLLSSVYESREEFQKLHGRSVQLENPNSIFSYHCALKFKFERDCLYGDEPNNLAQLELAINLGSTPAITSTALMFPSSNPFFLRLLNIAAQRKESVALAHLIDFHWGEEKNIISIRYFDELKKIFDNVSSRFFNCSNCMRTFSAYYLSLNLKLANFCEEKDDQLTSISYHLHLKNYLQRNWRVQLKNLINPSDDKFADNLCNSFFQKLDSELLPKALFKLAQYYLDSNVSEIKPQEAFNNFYVSWQNSTPDSPLKGKSAYHIAHCYHHGIGVKADMSKCLETFYSSRPSVGNHHLPIEYKQKFSIEIGEIALGFKEPYPALALVEFYYAAICGSGKGFYYFLKYFNSEKWEQCFLPYFRRNTIITNSDYLASGILEHHQPWLGQYRDGLNALEKLFYDFLDISYYCPDEKNKDKDPTFKVMMAGYYLKGIAEAKNPFDTGIKLLKEAAELDSGLACFLFACHQFHENKPEQAAFYFRKGIFYGFNALEFLKKLYISNLGNVNIFYHYCMSSLKRLSEQLFKNGHLFIRLWQKEFSSLPEGKFKTHTLDLMHKAYFHIKNPLNALDYALNQGRWYDKVIYQEAMHEIQREKIDISKIVQSLIRISPYNLSPVENFNAGFFLFNLLFDIKENNITDIKSLNIPNNRKQTYSHLRESAIYGYLEARRFLLAIACSRLKEPDEKLEISYLNFLQTDTLFFSKSFKILKQNLLYFHNPDKYKYIETAGSESEMKIGFWNSKSIYEYLQELFPMFILEEGGLDKTYFLCPTSPMGLQGAAQLTEKLNFVLTEAQSPMKAKCTLVEFSKDNTAYKIMLSSVNKTSLLSLLVFRKQILNAIESTSFSLDLAIH